MPTLQKQLPNEHGIEEINEKLDMLMKEVEDLKDKLRTSSAPKPSKGYEHFATYGL